jgi:hypothetical protein
MQIAVIEEPEPIEASGQHYKELGLKHVNDFSKRQGHQGQTFTDLQKAYMNRDNLETSMGNVREQSHLGNVNSQMSRLQQDRSNMRYKMNPEELMKYNMKQEQERAIEEKRRHRFSRQKEIADRQFQRMQNFITMG